jgi:hypothetical protein
MFVVVVYTKNSNAVVCQSSPTGSRPAWALDVDTAVRVVGAATRAGAAAVGVAARVVVGPAVIAGADAVSVVESNKGGPGKEDAVHDAKGEAGLEHGAGPVGAEPVAGARDGDAGGGAVPGAAAAPGDAVGVGDAAQVVDGGDEGADKEQVDEGDEAGVSRGAVVAEEGEDGPGKGEDRDDEEEEDRGGREGVDFGVLVDEPGEHAHGGDEGEDLRQARRHECCGEEHDGRVTALRLG